MQTVDRRRFVGLLGAAGASVVCGAANTLAFAGPAAQDFDFIFLTDTHLEPELDANKGCGMAFRKMRSLKADFALHGGDHVFDALGVSKDRSLNLFVLYDKTQQDLGLKVYHTLGNHDCVGVYPQSGMTPADSLYGEAFYQDHIGKTG